MKSRDNEKGFLTSHLIPERHQWYDRIIDVPFGLLPVVETKSLHLVVEAYAAFREMEDTDNGLIASVAAFQVKDGVMGNWPYHWFEVMLPYLGGHRKADYVEGLVGHLLFNWIAVSVVTGRRPAVQDDRQFLDEVMNYIG